MIKNVLQYSLIFFSLFIFVVHVNAAEQINDYNTTIMVNSDATITVTEEIGYDFGDAQKHGIYRDIPVKYKARGGNYKLRVSNVSVVDGKGSLWNFIEQKNGNDLRIKIGDANKYVTGEKTYIITYTVARALNFIDGHPELYWNVIGDNWNVPMAKVHARVFTSNGIEIQENSCFAGAVGTTDSCLNQLLSDDNVYFAHENLGPHDVFTIVVGLPEGSIREPSLWQDILWIVEDNWILFIPVIVLIVMSTLWYLRGRDPHGRGTIVPEYDAPEDLTPSEIGTIVDENAHMKDVSAMFIDLAVRGYLKIKKIDKDGIFSNDDYELIKLRDESSLAVKFEKDFFQAIFGTGQSVKLSDLKNKFYKDLSSIRREIYQQTVTKQYFVANPKKVRSLYIGIGGFMAFAGFFVGGFVGGYGILALSMSGAIIAIFGFFMPQRTMKGALMRERIEGLKLYLETAEKDRINFHNAPEKNPERFEKLLPYAMVLGVETQWAQQFADIYTQTPQWYEGSGSMNSLLLANSLSTFSSKAGSTIASSPSSASSGGSGFSGGGGGGGFGGGGGGSW